MQALILAAGMGKRLGRYTKNATKCMVQVNGKALIEYAIESLVQNGIKKLIIVVGYKGDVLIDYISKKFNASNLNGMEIEYVENKVYDKTNNIYSLYLATDKLIQDDTLLLESDLIYKPSIIKKLIESPDPNLAVVSPFEPWMDGTCTLLDDNNYITGILDKAHFDWKHTENYHKTVNIYKFSKDFSTNYYVPFLEAYQKAFGKNEYYEQVLKVLSFLSSSVLKGLKVSGEEWYEIDDPADLAIAENRFATGSEKLKRLQHRYGGYWRFPQLKDYCYLVNPYFPPQKMIDELTASFKTLLTQYPSGAQEQSILAGKIYNILPENIAVGNGAAELIKSLGEELTGKILVPYPTFNEYPERFKNAEIVQLMTDKTDFTYTAADILNKVKESGAKTVLLINPDNPSGSFIKKDDMLNLLEELKKLDVKIFFDESFIDFAEKSIRYSLLKQDIIEKYPNLVVVKSISKSYGVPGLRLGLIANADAAYISSIKKANSIWNINSFAEYYLQIYEKYNSAYSAACDAIANERNRFISELEKIPNLKVYPSQANFVLCKLSGDNYSDKIAVDLLEKSNIYIKDLTGKKCFDEKRYLRLAVRNQADNDVLIAALKQIIK
ncbi:Histidinol-phosphate/aromatic aminotransferase [Treponema sp. JC4]|uniref:aminotransferase class I/II-fold pyridoxal phosphate-dependent enzyme n=1 Tax=Treponema sp. JC4 TaxID=1124982 RepID=UPI00025B0E7A|nr:aminotransferase class I/II-fold pyridoxal phosphate-dependent enzyme [Treponema sp. JC4]EID84118.1 Histidinol-phosphate/aromatic aminotransferase [Treponema sp. JC4]